MGVDEIENVIQKHINEMKFNIITELINKGVQLDLSNEKFFIG